MSDCRLAVVSLPWLVLYGVTTCLHGAHPAAAFRDANQPVRPVAETTLLAEAEEFRSAGSDGWQARPWGENYYAATFANAFLSRKAYLGAPEQGQRSAASIAVNVPAAGKYLALVRYEAVYRFQTQFRLIVEQGGQKKLDRLYGARDNLKIWAFKQGLKSDLSWTWGAVENLVWEGHDALVDLQPGKATLTLVADQQPEPAARRNIDLVMLTSDRQQVQDRIAKENYLPLDGMLTQTGDLYMRLSNQGGGPLTLTLPPGTEHSPYWVHMRTWKPLTLSADVGQATEWVEVGHLLDSLNDGQWNLAAKGTAPRYTLELAAKDAAGQQTQIARFEGLGGNVSLAYDADTRYSRRIRLADQVLYDLIDYLKKQPIRGTSPKQTLVYGYTFTHRDGDAKYNAAVDEFVRLIGGTALTVGSRNEIPAEGGLVRGYTDLRSVPTNKLEEHCQKLASEGQAGKIAVVSLGDEIGLAKPPANDHAAFRTWLQSQKVKPAEIDPALGDDWNKVLYSPSAETAKSSPGLFYYSKLYSYRYGIGALKERTDILRRYLPQAGIGANFSPHHSHMYLGEVHHWISLFREGGMTMPWGEDYIWQVPLGTTQMNLIMVDMYRAALRGRPEAKIQYYVMPHTPGQIPDNWRRQFYGDLAHGVKIFNLFEFRPVQAAYTENHTSDPAMFQAVRVALHELGAFEDILQAGQVRPAEAALWFSEAADVWDDNHHPFSAAKRSLYIAIRHAQIPLDFVVEGDELKSYKTLYLTDGHVSRQASQAIAAWVRSGGRLFATAGAGMWDELNQPNQTLRELLGVSQHKLVEAAGEPIRWEKQDLPFASPLAQVGGDLNGLGKLSFPCFGARDQFQATANAPATLKFADGSPALVSRNVGSGTATYCGFLPGLSYFYPALPKRPVDRGSTAEAMTHFNPTQFDVSVRDLVASAAKGVARPTLASQPLVETTLIQSPQGTLIPLVNWTSGPIKGLAVSLAADVPKEKATLASGGPVRREQRDGQAVLILDLDVADVLILR